MAEGLPADVKKNTESAVVVPELAHTGEGEFCSSEAAEIFGNIMRYCYNMYNVRTATGVPFDM